MFAQRIRSLIHYTSAKATIKSLTSTSRQAARRRREMKSSTASSNRVSGFMLSCRRVISVSSTCTREIFRQPHGSWRLNESHMCGMEFMSAEVARMFRYMLSRSASVHRSLGEFEENERRKKNIPIDRFPLFYRLLNNYFRHAIHFPQRALLWLHLVSFLSWVRSFLL